ncbi:MAG: PTS sugar transporter subunit IIA [Gammaproteobacteria bacterium]
MYLKDTISEEGIVFTTSVSSKKRALEILSESLAQQHTSISKSKVLDALLAREKLGSTGLGKGVAIPHCRIEDLDKIYVAMLKLEEGVDFEASDEALVTFLFCMVVPDDAEDDHLKLLANLAELLDNETVRQSIEKCENATCLYQLLCQHPKHLAA